MIGIVGNPRRDGKSSFGALIAYCEKDGRGASRGAYTGMQNIHFRESAAAEMASLAFENPRCKNPLMHIILSWREMELPTNGQIDEAVKITLQEFDLQDAQAVWIVHADTENRHVHIAANRIDPETYKAIQPAGRWTHKAIQRAARKIELAQGWSLETHGTYAVTADGALIEKGGQESGAPKLSKAALDTEANAAAKSAERISQEVAAKIIREARNWKELHERLAGQGIGFERKGSGAVLTVNSVAVKASKAGRDISLSKLEARFGKFQPRDAGITIRERETEPVDRVSEKKVKSDWERYTAAREQYFKKKKEAGAALNERQKAERAGLQAQQREERGKLFSESWKGRGALLNRQRSVMAAAMQGEKLNLRDRHNIEREELKKLFPARFFNFKTWLEIEASPESSISFRYQANGAATGNNTDDKPHKPQDIRNFTPSIWNKGGVAYKAEGEREAQFIDYGRKIVLSEKCGEPAILAALQLANQKWGGAEINGSEEYKRQCVRLAIRHNLKLSNPGLAKEVEEGKKRVTRRGVAQTGTHDKKGIFTRYAEAAGAERFRVTVTEFAGGGTKAFVHDRQNGGYEGKTSEGIISDLPKFGAYARSGKNIIVTPISPDKHHILVDDLTPENLKCLRDDGYSPACVIESSPENYQAIITIPSLEGDSAKDREAANRLTKELNIKYGDPKLSGSVHGHRLPPFANQKPKHRREDGTFPETTLIEANGGICEKARAKLEAIHAALREAEEKAQLADEARKNLSLYPAGNSSSAYWAHYRDIAAKFTGAMDCSRIDAMIGVRMRATGHTQGEVASAIEASAPAMRRETMSVEAFAGKYGNRDWRRYANETASKYVFGARGTVQFNKALRYIPYYMRLEGRDAIEEQRMAKEQANSDKKENRGR